MGKRKLEARDDVEPSEEGVLEMWRNHPRVRGHAQKFEESRMSKRATILKRYARKALSSSRAELLQHTSHVGSWVALLPDDVILDSSGTNGHCAVGVLADLLRKRGPGPVTPWLCGILQLIQQRVGKHGSHVGWARLYEVMPLNAMRRAGPVISPTDAADSCDEVETRDNPQDLRPIVKEVHRDDMAADTEARMKLQLRRLHKQAQIFTNASAEERCSMLQGLERATQASLEQWDPTLAMNLLRKVAAWLSPPRCKASQAGGIQSSRRQTGTEKHLNSSSIGGDIQTRLRKILVRLLDMFDLTDKETQSNLRLRCVCNRVGMLMDEFVSRNDTVVSAQSSKQWIQISKRLDGMTLHVRQDMDTLHLQEPSVPTSSADARTSEAVSQVLPTHNRTLPKKRQKPTEPVEAAASTNLAGVFASATAAVAAINAAPPCAPGTNVSFFSTKHDIVYTLVLSVQKPPHWYCNCPAWKYQNLGGPLGMYYFDLAPLRSHCLKQVIDIDLGGCIMYIDSC